MSIEKLGVVGAGMMGSEIALVFAMVGKSVLLADTSEEGLNAAVKKLSEVLDSGIARGFWQRKINHWRYQGLRRQRILKISQIERW